MMMAVAPYRSVFTCVMTKTLRLNLAHSYHSMIKGTYYRNTISFP